MTFKPTDRYRRRLENYLEWARCTTPMDAISKPALVKDGPAKFCDTPEEAIFIQETYGRNGVCVADMDLLPAVYCQHVLERHLHPLFKQYVLGKANRDWWTKELGWWNKHAPIYFREEFASHLTPECFLELFGVEPIVARMRFFFDNSYSETDFDEDMRLAALGLERCPSGLEITLTTPGELLQTRRPAPWQRDNRYALEAT